MATLPVRIAAGLDDSHRRQGAEVLFEAFSGKLGPIARTLEQGVAVIDGVIDPQMAIVALSDQGLLGVAGLRTGQRGFLNFRVGPFVRQLGWLRGMPACLLMQTYVHKPAADQMVLECLAVSAAARGQGVGTQLLEAVCRRAEAEGLRSVCLDVLETNPRARELYERVGFVAAKTRCYPLLRRWLGQSAVITMVKTIY